MLPLSPERFIGFRSGFGLITGRVWIHDPNPSLKLKWVMGKGYRVNPIKLLGFTIYPIGLLGSGVNPNPIKTAAATAVALHHDQAGQLCWPPARKGRRWRWLREQRTRGGERE